MAAAAIGFINGRTWQVVSAEFQRVRSLPSSYRYARNGGDSALPEWREAMARNLYGARCWAGGRTVPEDDAHGLEVCDEG
ncbi:hypothetical protein [Streptomyces sp. NPDC005046]